jgi:hypothetical protein
MSFCVFCGKKIADDDKFCPYCGKKQPDAAPPIPIQQVPRQQAPIQQAPIQQVPVQQAPIQQAPVNQLPIHQVPVQERSNLYVTPNEPAVPAPPSWAPYQPVAPAQPNVYEGGFDAYGETTVLGGQDEEEIGATTVLSENQIVLPVPHLTRISTGEVVTIDKPVFSIGKGKGSVDYYIAGNTAISRYHLELYTYQSGEYFVQDINSTNHTYINGEIVKLGVETQVFDGEIIKLADEEFEFAVY